MLKIFDIASPEQLRTIAQLYGTPTYVYSQESLKRSARKILSFPNAYGLTVRYAIKANPHGSILKTFHDLGLHFDASHENEVYRALYNGIPIENIQLTAQIIPKPETLKDLLSKGLRFNACSLEQLRSVAEVSPEAEISIRINPPHRSGHNPKTITGGKLSSFGIWHSHLSKAKKIIKSSKLKIAALHSHIGSGTDPEIWVQSAATLLNYARQFPGVSSINLGGGFKVRRVEGEKDFDFAEFGEQIKKMLADFSNKTGRKLRLEIEPGTALVANSGLILTRIEDIKFTTKKYNYLLLDSGFAENTRHALYGSKHPVAIISTNPAVDQDTDKVTKATEKEYFLCGRCCESGDSWGRVVLPEAKVGDLLVLGGSGAYCAGMNLAHYNSGTEAAEVMIVDNKICLIRKREKREDLYRNEII
jgi:diaminopimelate decarboxylase